MNLEGTPFSHPGNLYGEWSTLPGRGRADFTDLQGLQGLSSEDEVPGGIEDLKMRKNRMETLMTTVNELNTAMESFVASVVKEEPRDRDDNGTESETKDEEEEAEEKGPVVTTNGVH